LANKIRAMINGEIVIVAYLDEDNQWVYTEEGTLLYNEHSNLAVEEAAAPKTRKKAAAVVESAEPEVTVASDVTE
jgi:hypothetical protein